MDTLKGKQIMVWTFMGNTRIQVGAFEILSERTKWMGKPGLCKESVTEYWRTEGQPAAFGNDAAGCFFVLQFQSVFFCVLVRCSGFVISSTQSEKPSR